MPRLGRAQLLMLTLFALLPSIGTAGGPKTGWSGFITLVNATPYNWWKSAQSSGNMTWTLPDVITAGSTATRQVSGTTKAAGVATFNLEGTEGLSFQLNVRGSEAFVKLTTFSTLGNPQNSTIDLGTTWSGATVKFILAGEVGKFTSSNPPNAWMHASLGALGNRSLRQLCIPGSHDAGMSKLTIGGTIGANACNTLTQYMRIFQQLQRGVRFFDIRPVIARGEYYTGHYTGTALGTEGGNGQSIASIIDDVNTYTAANQELVVLYFSHDMNTDVGYRSFTQDEWNGLFTELMRLNYRFEDPNPEKLDLTQLTLQRFIGSQPRVVIVVEPKIPLGTFATQGFYTVDPNFPVVNDYSNTNNLNTMLHDQLTKLWKDRPSPDAPSFVLSWTLTQSPSDAVACFLFHSTNNSILALAEKANPALYSEVLPVCNDQTYPNILYIDGVIRFDIAALAMAVNSKASRNTPHGYVIYKGSDDTGIYVAHSPDSNLANGDAWTFTHMSSAINSSDAPGAVSFQAGIYVLYKGPGSDSRIYIAKAAGGNILAGDSWQAQPLNPAINTSTAPGVAVFGNSLYMLYKGAGLDSGVYIATSPGNDVSDGNSWTEKRLVDPAINTSAAPAVAPFGGALYLFYKGAGGDANIYVARSTGDPFDVSTWSAQRLNPGINTSDAPGVVVFNNNLYMLYKGYGGDANIYIAQSTGDVFDGTKWTYTRLNPGINTSAAPKPVVVGDSLYLFYKGAAGDANIWIAQPQGADLFNGNAWTWERLNPEIKTSTAPGAAVR
jgi:hypothetical protein